MNAVFTSVVCMKKLTKGCPAKARVIVPGNPEDNYEVVITTQHNCNVWAFPEEQFHVDYPEEETDAWFNYDAYGEDNETSWFSMFTD